MSGRSREQILADLADLLGDWDGQEYSGDIGPETRFFGDLGLVSIDAVVLAEKLDRLYGRKLPFHQLLADLQKQQIDDIEVGTLVEFLHRHLNAA